MTKHLTPAQAQALHAAMLEDLEARGWLNDGAGGPEPPSDPGQMPPQQRVRVEESEPDRLTERQIAEIWWKLTPAERKRLLAEVKRK